MQITPFIIVSPNRTGSTFLAHCLSTHPDIFCSRDEPLDGRRGIWRLYEVPLDRTLLLLWRQYGYIASGCKANYKQFGQQAVMKLVQEHKPHVIHLTRANLVKQASSQFVLWYSHHGQMSPLNIPPAEFLKRCGLLKKVYTQMRKTLALLQVPVLEVEYGQMIGSEGRQAPWVEPIVAGEICRFLGVCDMTLVGNSKRVGRPLSDTYSNWDEIRAAIAKSEFAPWLKREC